MWQMRIQTSCFPTFVQGLFSIFFNTGDKLRWMTKGCVASLCSSRWSSCWNALVLSVFLLSTLEKVLRKRNVATFSRVLETFDENLWPFARLLSWIGIGSCCRKHTMYFSWGESRNIGIYTCCSFHQKKKGFKIHWVPSTCLLSVCQFSTSVGPIEMSVGTLEIFFRSFVHLSDVPCQSCRISKTGLTLPTGRSWR